MHSYVKHMKILLLKFLFLNDLPEVDENSFRVERSWESVPM